MMAFDSSRTPPSRLDPAAIAELRVALGAYLAKSEDRAPLQAALARLAAEARDKGIPPEQLLVVLKEIWNGLPEVRAASDASAQVTLLQRAVTMCIREYYA